MGKTIYTERDVVEKFGRSLPKYRKIKRQNGYKRMFDKTDRAEMDAVRDWLVHDDEFLRLVDIYASYCRILANRGYGSSDDIMACRSDHPGLVSRLADNFAKCEVEYVWYELIGSASAILTGDGSADGYWPFLDKAYLDIANMTVGKAIINLDEIWAVVEVTMDEFIQKCASREALAVANTVYTCDRCGAKIYVPSKSRFDHYENLLHCEKCVKECTHWKGHKK